MHITKVSAQATGYNNNFYKSQQNLDKTSLNNKSTSISKYSTNNTPSFKGKFRQILGFGVLLAGVGGCTYSVEKNYVEKHNNKMQNIVQNQIYNEKNLFVKKTMTEEEFMSRMKDIIETEEDYNDIFNPDKTTPNYIEILYKSAQEMYKKLSPAQKKELKDVRTYIKNAVENPDKDMSLAILNGEPLDKNYSKKIQEKALTVVTALEELAESDINIRTGDCSKEEYYNTVKEIVNLYFEGEELPANILYSAKGLKQIRDSIANNMTQKEKDEFNAKYNACKQEYMDAIKDYKGPFSTPYGVTSLVLYFLFGCFLVFNYDRKC